MGSTRTAEQTETALFYNDNVVRQLVLSLADFATRHPQDIFSTARMFALVNASVTDGLITTWRLNYVVGYWRPITAIHEAGADDNPATVADPDWAPLVTTPPYPHYVSGHASIVNAFTESLALVTGSRDTDLEVSSAVTGTMRHYSSLDTLSDEGLNARIWLGIHFRDAMEDARFVGEQAARIADDRLD